MKLKTLWWEFLFAFPQIWKGFTFGQKNPMKTDSAKPGAFLAVFAWWSCHHLGFPTPWGRRWWVATTPCWPHHDRWRPHGMPSPCCRRMAQWCGGAVAVVVPWTLGAIFFVWSDFLFDILFFVSFFFLRLALCTCIHDHNHIWQYCYHLLKLFFDLTERFKLQRNDCSVSCWDPSFVNSLGLKTWALYWARRWLATPKLGGDLFPGPWSFSQVSY